MMQQPTTSRAAIALVTLGCAKNEVDSAEMVSLLTQADYRIVDDPALADLIIVNTCSFIQSATEESIDTIFAMLELERRVPIIVSGCMPARYGEDLVSELPEVKAFVACADEEGIAEVVSTVLAETGFSKTVCPVGALPAHAFTDETGVDPLKPFAGETEFSAYVKISDGCDRFCSFCAIPYIRGRYHSFTAERIEASVAAKVAAGAREITLIAQDTGRWGEDFEEPDTLAHLLEHLSGQFPSTWFRVMYLEPVGVTDDLLATIASHDNICDYLDIPLQHCDAQLLKAMNRSGSSQEFLALISRIRKAVPGITLRTTLISGFPGETEEAHEALLDFLSEAVFDYVGVFPYSAEDGTRAARLEDQVDEDVKIRRAQEVRDLADVISSSRISSRIGSELDVLILGKEEDGQLYGRAMCQAPEVDGVTFVSEGVPGTIVSVTIGDTMFYEMEAL